MRHDHDLPADERIADALEEIAMHLGRLTTIKAAALSAKQRDEAMVPSDLFWQ